MGIQWCVVGNYFVVGKRKTPLTESEVRALEPTDKHRRVTVDLRLVLDIESEKKGGGKSFDAVYRFGSNSNPKYYRLGRYGNRAGQLSLRQAKEAQRELEIWMENNPQKSPTKRKQELKIEKLSQDDIPNFGKLIDIYLRKCGNRESTIKNDRTRLMYCLQTISASTKLKHLEWHSKFDGKTGRQRVMDVVNPIQERGKLSQAKKVYGSLRVLFSYAISRGWMGRDENPAQSSGTNWIGKGHKEKSQPALSWDELPELFRCLEENPARQEPITLYALKCLFLTGLRVSSLVQIRWDFLNEKEGWIHVPAAVMKSDRDFDVPLIPPLVDALDALGRFNGEKDYVFWSFRGSEDKPHLCSESPNKALRSMGFKGRQTAHGIRAVITTCGQEQLGFERELVLRCISHKIGTKLSRRYDRTEFFEERKEFMTRWGDALLEHGLRI